MYQKEYPLAFTKTITLLGLNPSNLIRFAELLSAMTGKEIKARYKRAIFGFLWILLNPLLQMIIIGTVFSFFIDMPDYFLFLFAGLLPWQFFSLSLSKSTPSFVNESPLLQKANFQKVVIPLSIILANFFHLLVAISLLIIYLVIFQKLHSDTIWFLPVALVWLLVVTIGVTLTTASLNVKYRDINFFVQSLLTLWFYATPVLYALTLIPTKLIPLYHLNPLTGPFLLLHAALVGSSPLPLSLLFSNLLFTVVIFGVGVLVFRRHHPYFVDWL